MDQQGNRWGSVSAQKFAEPAPGSLGADEIAPAVEALRKSFASEKTYSKEWRVGQLKALQRLIVEGRAELCEAMRADLHKSSFEGYVRRFFLPATPAAHRPPFTPHLQNQPHIHTRPPLSVDGARPGRVRDRVCAGEPRRLDGADVDGHVW